MNILDMGLEKRMLHVAQETSEDQAVLNAQALFDEYFKQLNEQVENRKLLLWLEDAVNQLRYAECDAAYRIGISDGMQIQQETNKLIKGGR